MMPALIYHGTPMTPASAMEHLRGRAFCVPYARDESLDAVLRLSPAVMGDCSAYTFWKLARRAGTEFEERERDWSGYYDWLDRWIWEDGRWAIIPDRIAAPTQLNDALLNDWPHGREKGSPVFHMDGPVSRLLRLAESYPRVCLGWVGEFDPTIGDIRPDQRRVGCDAFLFKMEEIDRAFGNRWPVTHMLRGIAVAGLYPFDSADATSLAQNNHRYQFRLGRDAETDRAGLVSYADRLERCIPTAALRRRLAEIRRPVRRRAPAQHVLALGGAA